MRMYPYPTRKGLEKLKDFSTRVIRQMGRNALRRIHEYRSQTGTMPTVDELESWITDHHPRARHDFDVDHAQQMAYSAAVFALGTFDPAEYAVRVKRAQNGGKKSRRGASFTTAQLAAVEALSIPQQAEALGCSVSTISRLRRQHRAEQLVEIDALFDTPKAPVDPISETKPADPVSEPAEVRTAGMSIQIPDHVPVDWTTWTREDAHRHEEQQGLQNLDLSAFDVILTEA